MSDIKYYFHGTNYNFGEDIDLSFCNPKCDFGRGFYITENRNQAANWAIRNTRDLYRNNTQRGMDNRKEYPAYVKVYSFDKNNHNGLSFLECNREWASTILAGRTSSEDEYITHLDYMEGAMATGKFKTIIKELLDENGISIERISGMSFLRRCNTFDDLLYCMEENDPSRYNELLYDLSVFDSSYPDQKELNTSNHQIAIVSKKAIRECINTEDIIVRVFSEVDDEDEFM